MTVGEAIRAAHRRHVDMWDAWAKADAQRVDGSTRIGSSYADVADSVKREPEPSPGMATLIAW